MFLPHSKPAFIPWIDRILQRSISDYYMSPGKLLENTFPKVSPKIQQVIHGPNVRYIILDSPWGRKQC